MVEVTASALSGAPVPPLGVLGAPKPEDVQMIEKQRQRLQECWGLLRCTGTETELMQILDKIYITYAHLHWLTFIYGQIYAFCELSAFMYLHG